MFAWHRAFKPRVLAEGRKDFGVPKPFSKSWLRATILPQGCIRSLPISQIYLFPLPYSNLLTRLLILKRLGADIYRQTRIAIEVMTNRPSSLEAGALRGDLMCLFGHIEPKRRAQVFLLLVLMIIVSFAEVTVMLQASVVDRFAEGMRYAEDYHLWLRILLSNLVVYRLRLPMAFSFKSEFSDAGLSGNMRAMHQGEIMAFNTLLATGHISYPTLAISYLYRAGVGDQDWYCKIFVNGH